jgi:hypothetical protein
VPEGDLHAGISELINEHDRLWSTLQFDAIGLLWDADEPEPWYMADELDDAASGWGECRRAWLRLSGRVKRAQVQSHDIAVRALADDLAITRFVTDWILEPIEVASPYRGQSRGLAVVRRRGGHGGRWLFSALTESSFHRSEGGVGVRGPGTAPRSPA